MLCCVCLFVVVTVVAPWTRVVNTTRLLHFSQESTMVRWPLVFLSLRVLNISYEKTVFVRATFNGWKTFVDFPASYVETAQDQLTVGFQVCCVVCVVCVCVCVCVCLCKYVHVCMST